MRFKDNVKCQNLRNRSKSLGFNTRSHIEGHIDKHDLKIKLLLVVKVPL